MTSHDIYDDDNIYEHDMEGLHGGIIDWARDTARAIAIDENEARIDIALTARILLAMPPARCDEWAKWVEDSRPYIDRAFTLLRAAQHASPARAAAALRNYLEEIA